IADTLSLPSAPLNSFSARGPASRSMSSLLDMTSMATGARDLASSQSLERIQRAYERLQALGL
ncbi:MAG: hypothetical protein AAFY81_07200, partial [Pseudomonadota bacterium]